MLTISVTPRACAPRPGGSRTNDATSATQTTTARPGGYPPVAPELYFECWSDGRPRRGDVRFWRQADVADCRLPAQSRHPVGKRGAGDRSAVAFSTEAPIVRNLPPVGGKGSSGGNGEKSSLVVFYKEYETDPTLPTKMIPASAVWRGPRMCSTLPKAMALNLQWKAFRSWDRSSRSRRPIASGTIPVRLIPSERRELPSSPRAKSISRFADPYLGNPAPRFSGFDGDI